MTVSLIFLDGRFVVSFSRDTYICCCHLAHSSQHRTVLVMSSRLSPLRLSDPFSCRRNSFLNQNESFREYNLISKV